MRPRQTPSTPTETGAPRRRRRTALSLVAVATLGAGLVAAVPAQAVPTTIDIVGINDFHGRIAQESSPVAGAAVMSGFLDDFRTTHPNTSFVSSGDNIGASTFTSFIQQDAPTLAALNAMELDVSALGNHEFDRGQDDLNGRVTGASEFPYLGANVFRADGSHAYDPYFVKEVGGVRVGYIGAITELMPELVSPSGIAGLTFGDIVDSVNDVADDLTDLDPANGEADVLVLLVHEGNSSGAALDTSGDFARIATDVSPKVDAILSGHTHQSYDFSVVPTGGTVPRPVVQTGSYGAALSHLAITFDAESGATTVTSELLPLYKQATPDPEVAKIVSDAVALAAVEGAKTVGTITADLNRARQPDGSENRGGESTLGNFVADVQLAATAENGSQIAFMNPGGLRADLKAASTGAGDPDGNVTFAEAAAVQPFANTLVVVDMTGDQVRQALEQQWQPASASRPFLKLGVSKGLAYTYDPAAPAGSRIQTITLDGQLLDPAASYKVTVNSFLASGGDNFGAFATGSAADSGKVDLQAQVDWFTANPGAASPDLAQRAVGVSSPDDVDETGYAIGDRITVDLSSLIFSDQVAPATLDVSYGGSSLGSVALDSTLVLGTDEQGRAQLLLDVVAAPAPTARALVLRELELAVPGTGTTVSLAVPLPEEASLVLANALVVDPPVDPAPVDPTDPAAPAPGVGAGGGAGAGTGAGTSPRPSGVTAAGDLAYTGSDAATTGLALALVLLLTGAGVLTATRLRRRRTASGTTSD